MLITVDFAKSPANRAYSGELRSASGTSPELLWQCYLSGQMDEAALEREIACNPRFRQYVAAMEQAAYAA